jgi:hypothetical protein
VSHGRREGPGRLPDTRHPAKMLWSGRLSAPCVMDPTPIAATPVATEIPMRGCSNLPRGRCLCYVQASPRITRHPPFVRHDTRSSGLARSMRRSPLSRRTHLLAFIDWLSGLGDPGGRPLGAFPGSPQTKHLSVCGSAPDLHLDAAHTCQAPISTGSVSQKRLRVKGFTKIRDCGYEGFTVRGPGILLSMHTQHLVVLRHG